LISAAATIALALGLAPSATATGGDSAGTAGDISVYVSFEGYNLGQGYYVQPVKLTVPAGETAAQATMSVLDQSGHATSPDPGDPTSAGWYLQGVGGFDTGTVTVPSYIMSQPGFALTGADSDNFLGTPDYNSMSGWMYTVDNIAADVGGGAYTLHDGDVVRWQFTLYGYGCDLGVPSACYGGTPYFSMVDKSELIRDIANADPVKATSTEIADALTVAVNPTATQQQVNDSIVALTTSPWNYALTVPSGATVTVLNQTKNYAQTAIATSGDTDNGDGTTTHHYQVSTGGTYTYRVSAPGKVTQANWITNTNPVTVTFPTDGDPTATGTHGTSYDAFDDAGVLLNINADNNLRLAPGADFTLAAFRAPWQIVNNVVSNYMIEPDYHWTVLSGNDVVSITPDASLPNWSTLHANKAGQAVVEVGYDAIDVGAAQYGATNPVRKDVFVVTVGDNQDTSLTVSVPKNADSPNTSWDSEFDTWYLQGASSTGTITVSGSPTSVTLWNPDANVRETLTADGSTYHPVLYPGNNIIEAAKDGAVTDKIIRAAAVTPVITNVTDPGSAPAAGEQVTIHLDGAYLPVPKMAGIYNPNISSSLYPKVTYSDGANTFTGNSGGQYTFSSTNTLTVNIPADAPAGYKLTGGYIFENHLGSAPGAHRALTKAGVPANLNASAANYNWGRLPDITLIAADMKGTAPSVPVVSSATAQARAAGAAWLAGQLAANGNVLANYGQTDWGLTEDAVLALAGAKVGGTQIATTANAIYHSGEQYIGAPSDTAFDWPYIAKTVLALQVAGLDPTTFPDGGTTRDLVAEVRSALGADGTWTNATDAFKTSLGILALARTAQGVPANAVTAFEAMACSDSSDADYGSFGFGAACSGGDVDTTSMAVQALLAAGVSTSDPAVANATEWLLDQQANDGSFPSQWAPGNTNSGGLAGEALFAVGKTSEAQNSASFIQSLQIVCSTAAEENITGADVSASVRAANGAIAYDADGWSTAMTDGLDSSNLDQWRRASAQAVLGLGAESLGFVSAAGAAPGVPATSCSAAPAITTQPIARTVTAGQGATFTAAASGNPAPAVQWQSKIGSGAWGNVRGATGSTLTVSGTSVAQSGTQYRAVFTNSSGTATTGAVMLTVKARIVAPGAPTGLALTAGKGRAGVTWRAPSATGGAKITGYRVQYSANGGKTWATKSYGTAVRETLAGLRNGTTYRIRVAAVNSAGTGAYTAAKSVKPRTVAGKARSLKVKARHRALAVAWKAPKSNGGVKITKYRVQYKIAGGRWKTKTVTASTHKLTLKKLKARKRYVVRVAAVNAAGAGAYATSKAVAPKK